tara:strand:- start:836 stop:1141 length:306 start_codon:yes stop_codon:yes gene_type:complete
MPEEMETFALLGYPTHLPIMLWIAKLLGVLVVLVPKLPLLKKWIYAGLFFMMLGAILSHLASRSQMTDSLPALLLLVLTIVSWYNRPDGRRIATVKKALPY